MYDNINQLPAHLVKLNPELLTTSTTIESVSESAHQQPILEELFLQQTLSSTNLPEPDQEYRFHPFRRWRFDFAWPEDKLAVEIEGGTWVNGRHNRPKGFEADCEKYNAATLLGWRVLRFTGDMVRDKRGITTLWQAVAQR